MYVKSIVLDGFKSYSEKTTIRGLDRRFTAITGANGSGKSNVIDALLFVLDLGSNKQLRVGSASELINTQKRECCVKVLFDNRTHPVIGYEHLGEIEIERSLDVEGKSKWKINGHTCSRGSIEALRRAAGISENSVVLQGRITKILGMHRNELREMLEEAAGTKSYNLEKKRACEVLEKKEEKLREVKEWLKRTIEPYVTRLNEERKEYERQKNALQSEEKLRQEIKKVESQLVAATNAAKVSELARVVSEAEEKNKELRKVEGVLAEVNVDDVFFEDKADMQKKIERLREELEGCDCSEDKIKLCALENEASKLSSITTDDTTTYTRRKEYLEERERILKSELYGEDRIEELEKLRRSRTRAKLILDRLKGTKYATDLSATLSLVEDSMKNLSQASGPLHKKYLLFMQMLRDGARDKRKLEVGKNAVKEFIRLAEKEAENIQSKLIYTPGNGIYGTVDENYTLKEKRYETAVNVILGGKARFIITDTDERAALVISKSSRKISCIPLNKIAGGSRRVYKGGINALDVVDYNEECKKAFEWLLGSTLIFEDPKEAEVACFEGKVMCVSLDGVVYNPHGTLTGGSAPPYVSSKVRGVDLQVIRSAIEVCHRLIKEVVAYESEYEAKEEEENARKEFEKATESIELLERLCKTAVDVRGELERVREEIHEVERIEKAEQEQNEHADSLNKRIIKLKSEIQEKESRAETLSNSLSDLYKALEAAEEKSARQKHLGDVNAGLDLQAKRKQLLSQIAKLSIYASRLYSEIEDSSQKENTKNNSNIDVIKNFLQNKKTTKNFTDSEVQELSTKAAALKKELKSYATELRTTKTDPRRFELLDLHLEMMRDLESKIARLENDRVKITQTMERLSSLGAEANHHAFISINKNIGKFFSYFVPNSEVAIDQNYDIRVKIGSWVNSLDELSGGQRSLIALSLIFSILAHNPASLYVFDEIDAALDMNYSQSIGEIIRKEFQYSQFIVISLKNNLFANANRIFRVQVQDQKPIVIQIK